MFHDSDWNPAGLQRNLKFAPGTDRMAVTMFCQYVAKLAASVSLCTVQGYQVPSNSQPGRKMALPKPRATRFLAMATKLAFSSPAAPWANVFSGLPELLRATMGTPITIWSLVPDQLESQLAKVDGVVR